MANYSPNSSIPRPAFYLSLFSFNCFLYLCGNFLFFVKYLFGRHHNTNLIATLVGIFKRFFPKEPFFDIVNFNHNARSRFLLLIPNIRYSLSYHRHSNRNLSILLEQWECLLLFAEFRRCLKQWTDLRKRFFFWHFDWFRLYTVFATILHYFVKVSRHSLEYLAENCVFFFTFLTKIA